MREKSELRALVHESAEVDAERVRSDLEHRGVAPEFSRPISRRLVEIAADLSAPEYAAILDGVSTAYGVYREIAGATDSPAREGYELNRLMDGFKGELHKLDEGLRMLSAYLVRMSALLSREGSESLH